MSCSDPPVSQVFSIEKYVNKTRKTTLNHESDRPDLVCVVRMRSSPREDFSIALFLALLFWCLVIHLVIKNSVTYSAA